MKKVTTGLLLCLVIAVGASIAYASLLDFSISNNSGYTITYIYASPDYSSSWEEDILGSSVLYSGNTINITIPDGYNNHCYWDLKVILETGDEASWGGIDLCSVANVNIWVDGYNINASFN